MLSPPLFLSSLFPLFRYIIRFRSPSPPPTPLTSLPRSSCLPVLFPSLPWPLRPPIGSSRFVYLLSTFFFFLLPMRCVYDACVPQDHVLRFSVQTNRESTGWPFNPLEPPPFTLLAVFACRFSAILLAIQLSPCLPSLFHLSPRRYCSTVLLPLRRTCPLRRCFRRSHVG